MIRLFVCAFFLAQSASAEAAIGAVRPGETVPPGTSLTYPSGAGQSYTPNFPNGPFDGGPATANTAVDPNLAQNYLGFSHLPNATLIPGTRSLFSGTARNEQGQAESFTFTDLWEVFTGDRGTFTERFWTFVRDDLAKPLGRAVFTTFAQPFVSGLIRTVSSVGGAADSRLSPEGRALFYPCENPETSAMGRRNNLDQIFNFVLPDQTR